VTSSPSVLLSGLIQFQPPLPSAKIAGFESFDMFRAMKIILKFKKRPWPKNLQGMIMSAKDCLVPEMWFRDVNPPPSDDVEKMLSIGEESVGTVEDEAVCIASGFATAKYADRLLSLSEEEMYKTVLVQMDEVFSHLTSNHMSAHPSDEDEKPETLPSPSSVFIKAMYHDWKKYPYIGGGYSCARTGWNLDNCKAIAESICVGRSGGIFFAGEATNVTQPGGTAHAALETGVRAADEVSAYLDMYFD
jgi:monoamine oxidase